MIVATKLPDVKSEEEIAGPRGKTIIFAVEYDKETGEYFPSVIKQFDNSEFYGQLVGMIAIMRNDSITRKRNN